MDKIDIHDLYGNCSLDTIVTILATKTNELIEYSKKMDDKISELEQLVDQIKECISG